MWQEISHSLNDQGAGAESKMKTKTLLEAGQWWAKRLEPLPSAIARNKELLPARKSDNLLEHRYECNGGLATPAPQCAHRP